MFASPAASAGFPSSNLHAAAGCTVTPPRTSSNDVLASTCVQSQPRWSPGRWTTETLSSSMPPESPKVDGESFWMTTAEFVHHEE